MATMRKKLNADEIRSRAAIIRRNWSPDERNRRMGLPPDMPPRIRQFIHGSSAEWAIAVVYAR